MISVIIPAYNVEKYIVQCLESLIAQSYDNIEIIVVDDKSTDNTAVVVDQYTQKYKNIKLIQRDINSGGCFIPRCQGIAYCRGQYIVEIDADDWVGKDYLQNLYDRLIETNADIVCSQMTFVYSNGKIADKTIPASGNDMQQVISGKDAFRQTINGFKISLAGSLIKADKYKSYIANQVIDKVTAWKDEVCRREFLLLCDIVAQVRESYFYRQNETSVVHNISLNNFNRLVVEGYLWEIIKRNFPGDEALKRDFSAQYIDLYYRMNQLYYGDMHKTFAKEVFARQSLKNAIQLIKREKLHCRTIKHKLIVNSKISLYLLLMLARIYWKIKH